MSNIVERFVLNLPLPPDSKLWLLTNYGSLNPVDQGRVTDAVFDAHDAWYRWRTQLHVAGFTWAVDNEGNVDHANVDTATGKALVAMGNIEIETEDKHATALLAYWRKVQRRHVDLDEAIQDLRLLTTPLADSSTSIALPLLDTPK